MFGPHVHGLSRMRGIDRATPIVIVAMALTGVTCAFPTDKSDKVLVTLEGPSHVVLRGQEMSVHARAWRVIGPDTQPITNVAFAFGTGSSTTATVQNDGGGYATVTGVNSGMVDITARAISLAFPRPRFGLHRLRTRTGCPSLDRACLGMHPTRPGSCRSMCSNRTKWRRTRSTSTRRHGFR